MTDRREEILVRMLGILSAVEGSSNAFRNRSDVHESLRPCIVLVDGDEEAEQQDSNRAGRTPRRVRMTPHVLLMAGGPAETIGTQLNDLRKQAIYELCSDAQLKALSLQDNDVVYEGAQMIMDEGRRIEGVMVLVFTVTYLLRPIDLAASG